MERVHPHGLFVATLVERTRPIPAAHQQVFGRDHRRRRPIPFSRLFSPISISHLWGRNPLRGVPYSGRASADACEGVEGTRFAVWAPNALIVSVVGDFNGWDRAYIRCARKRGGIWEIFIPGIGTGTSYKYAVKSRFHGTSREVRPLRLRHRSPASNPLPSWWPLYTTISGRTRNGYRSGQTNLLDKPISIYEVHLGSWLRGRNGSAELSRTGRQLVQYVKDLGYTHIELCRSWSIRSPAPGDIR